MKAEVGVQGSSRSGAGSDGTAPGTRRSGFPPRIQVPMRPGSSARAGPAHAPKFVIEVSVKGFDPAKASEIADRCLQLALPLSEQAALTHADLEDPGRRRGQEPVPAQERAEIPFEDPVEPHVEIDREAGLAH